MFAHSNVIRLHERFRDRVNPARRDDVPRIGRVRKTPESHRLSPIVLYEREGVEDQFAETRCGHLHHGSAVTKGLACQVPISFRATWTPNRRNDRPYGTGSAVSRRLASLDTHDFTVAPAASAANVEPPQLTLPAVPSHGVEHPAAKRRSPAVGHSPFVGR